LNLPPEELNQTQLKIMLQWYKRAGYDKLPTLKQDQLARYYETCHRGDLEAPPLPLFPSAARNELQHDNVSVLEAPPPPTTVFLVENGAPLNTPNDDCSDNNLAVLDSGFEQHSHDERELALLLAAGIGQGLEGVTEVW
jgi:hypothetical protein